MLTGGDNPWNGWKLSPLKFNTNTKCFRNPMTGEIASIKYKKYNADIYVIVEDQQELIRYIVGIICGAQIVFGIAFAIYMNPWKTFKECCACCFVPKTPVIIPTDNDYKSLNTSQSTKGIFNSDTTKSKDL